MSDERMAAQGPVDVNFMGWMPIETAPTDTDILCYSENYAPHIFVGRYSMVEEREEVLVSESTHKSGKRRIYEERTTTRREWSNDTPSWGATHWMPLPEAPNSNHPTPTVG